jgi:hypothetical protein
MKAIWVVGAFLLAAVTLARSSNASGEFEHCSLINLIATPERYDAKKVQIIGVAVIRFEGTAVFLARDDAERGVRKNAVWLELEDHEKFQRFNGMYVVVQGTFVAAAKGHGGMYSGSLRDITRLDEWKSGG